MLGSVLPFELLGGAGGLRLCFLVGFLDKRPAASNTCCRSASRTADASGLSSSLSSPRGSSSSAAVETTGAEVAKDSVIAKKPPRTEGVNIKLNDLREKQGEIRSES